jgi:hypothetical protein
LHTDFKYLGVELFCLLEEALASFGVFVKYVILQPLKEIQPQSFIEDDLYVAPHQLFAEHDSAVRNVGGRSAMFVLLTDVDTMEAHYSVIHVQSTFKGDPQFMTAVKIQISPTAVVDGWKEEIKSGSNCAPYSAAVHLNLAKVPYPPALADTFAAFVMFAWPQR